MPVNPEPARVFVSCGQRDGDEMEVVHRLEALLRSKGFEPYVAKYQQSLRSLRENIFDRLSEQTEYFLFIDFRREKVGESEDRRGSVFSHQELAIASFLDFEEDIIVFQEHGVLERDGMIGAFQANAHRFQDRSELLKDIEKRIEENWHNNWRRKLVLDNNPSCVAVRQQSGATGFFFHVIVKNRHIRATARNCYAHLRSKTDAVTNQPIPFEAAALKWAGYSFPNAVVPPASFRRFDAVWFDSSSPQYPRFNIFSDWPQNRPDLHGPGVWMLEYEVISENVSGSTIPLVLEVRDDGTVRFGESQQPVRISPMTDSEIYHFNESQVGWAGTTPDSARPE
jgi:hypothetical protein